jgi:hypothetical protein
MTNEQYALLKQDYIDHIKEYVTENGSLFPHLTIFADVKKPKKGEEDKPALIHVPIPDEYMENDRAKDKFIDEVVPDLFQNINEKFIPKGIGWAAEAWMRVADKNFDVEKDNWKKIPIKKEVIMISIESDEPTESIIYEIKREGKQVIPGGDIVDIIKLEEQFREEGAPTVSGGRFTGLFKKLKG